VEVALPAVRRLVDASVAPAPVRVRHDQDFLSAGAVGDIVLRTLPGAPTIDADFTSHADRAGGLAAPKLVHDAFSRARGLVNSDAAALVAGAGIDPRKLLGEGSKLLGISLLDLVTPAIGTPLPAGPAQIVTGLALDGTPRTS